MATDAERPRKTTLFCPDCDHQSPADGDWTRIRGGQRVHYLCPDCRTEVTVRSARSDPPSPLSPYGLWTTWTTSVQAWWKSVLHS